MNCELSTMADGRCPAEASACTKPFRQASQRDTQAPLYVSAKRTHFNFVMFPMYHSYLEKLISFAVVFPNGFVLENEPIFRGLWGRLHRKVGLF